MKIKDIKELNKLLLKEIQLFYLPDWGNSFQFLTHDKIVEYIKCKNFQAYETKLYDFIIKPEYRARSRIKYEFQPIFTPLLSLIDHATICFYQSNYICAYFSLIPIIEGLLRKWSEETTSYTSHFEEKKFINHITPLIKAKHTKNNDNDQNYLMVCLYCDLLKDIVNKIFFNNNKECEKQNISFNRHLVSHLLKDPNYFESRKNTLRLFCFLDLISECYNFDKTEKSKTQIIKTSYNYSKTTNDRIQKREHIEFYLKNFYTKCLEGNNINFEAFEGIKSVLFELQDINLKISESDFSQAFLGD